MAAPEGKPVGNQLGGLLVILITYSTHMLRNVPHAISLRIPTFI